MLSNQNTPCEMFVLFFFGFSPFWIYLFSQLFSNSFDSLYFSVVDRSAFNATVWAQHRRAETERTLMDRTRNGYASSRRYVSTRPSSTIRDLFLLFYFVLSVLLLLFVHIHMYIYIYVERVSLFFANMWAMGLIESGWKKGR